MGQELLMRIIMIKVTTSIAFPHSNILLGMLTLYLNITLPNIKLGTHQLDLFSVSLGIENGGPDWGEPGMERSYKGIVGEIWLGPYNLTYAPGTITHRSGCHSPTKLN
jgi:hypothetical protein